MADTLTQSENSRRYVSSTATPTEVAKLLCCLCNSTVTEQGLLLRCLHCCCTRCAAAAVTTGSRDGVREQLPATAAAASVSVTCPQCQEVTEVAAVVRGGLLSAVARLAKAAADGRKAGYADGGGSPSSERRLQCDFCLEEGIAQQVAEHWCGECRRGLCASCLLAHNRFNRQHRAVSVSLASPPPQPLLLADSDASSASGAMAQCGRHSASLEMFCLTCERLRCVQCEGDRQCLATNHNVCASRGSDRVADLAGRLVADGRRAEAELRARRAQLPLTISAERLQEALDVAKRAHVDALAFNKRRLLDTVEIAHRKAESDLLSCYERVAIDVTEAARVARLLERRADYTLAYADAALGGVAAVACASGSATAAALLPQLKNVQQRLQTLADACALPATSAAAALADPARLVILDVEPPAEFDVVVARCLGVARPASSELGGTAGISGQEQLLDSGCMSLQSDRSISPAGSLSGMPLAADNGCDVPAALASSTADNEPLLCLAGRPPAAVFRAVVKCWDMAITKDGTVVLAAYAEGLREYNIDGRELSSWVPSQPPRRPGSGGPVATLESVYSVDVMSNGRVAVGLLRSRRVVVLCRQRLPPAAAGGGGFGWFEELYVELRSQPWRLACHGDLVAVAYSRYERAKYVPGPSLDLVSMSDRSVKLSRTLKYNVVSIAVAEQSIIVASDRQQLSTDPLSRWFIVDSYNHQGEQLWRHECEDSIYDIVTEPFGQLIYVAVGDSRRVIAIRGEDGHGEVIDVLPRAADGPVRLSLCHSGQHSALAVLLFDLQSVKVYSS